MDEKWITFDYDDGAEVRYKIDNESESVDFQILSAGEVIKDFSLFFDEVEEVYNKIKSL